MKIKVSEATNEQLNLVAAIIHGRVFREPISATYEDVANWSVPFQLFETVVTYVDDLPVSAEVKPITITRCGVHRELGATEPSISFTDHTGAKALGSIQDYYSSPEEAELACQQTLRGNADDYRPTEDAEQAYALQLQDRMCVGPYGDIWYAQSIPSVTTTYGRTPLAAITRCHVMVHAGKEVELPEELT